MSISVQCSRYGDGFRCHVEVSEGQATTRHEVRVSGADIKRWARGRSAEDLVRDSFVFLLQRESKESILRDFDLSLIKRYFADYDGG